jgi:hypothetical protein
MNELGVQPGSLEQVRMTHIENEDAVLHMEWMRRTMPDENPDDLVAHTHSVSYAETSITQSGHAIESSSISGGERIPISSFMRPDLQTGELSPERVALLQRYGFTLDDEVLYEYDVTLRVRRWP